VLTIIDRFLSKRSGNQIVLCALLLVACFAFMDLVTGYELSFSVFYTIPIGLVSWYVGVRFTYFIIILSLIDRLRLVLESQVGLAHLDGLTGILNSRGFREESDAPFRLAVRHARPVTLGYLDLDGFKRINDNFGHGVGDLVSSAIATTLQAHLRGSDRCARVGGDEFAILLPETGMEGGQVFFCRTQAAAQRTGRHQSLRQSFPGEYTGPREPFLLMPDTLTGREEGNVWQR
jgi:diguanylate cyclase (GGDEF)-like protein